MSDKQKASTFRRYKIVQADVDRTIKHMKLHGGVTPNDRLTRPLKKPKRDGTIDEEIRWTQAGPLMGSWQSKDLKSGPKGQLVLYGQEDGTWKRIVPQEEIETYVRGEMLSSDSRMPLSRDSAHYYLMKHTLGISRRAAYKFLEKQAVLQVTKNIPNERVKGGQKLHKRGCEMDLIEGQGRDVTNYLGPTDDWYWLSLVENLTGFGFVVLVTKGRIDDKTKGAKFVAAALKNLLPHFEAKLKAKVHTIASDHGREFFAEVKALLKRRGIAQKQVPRGSRVEKFNQDFQRTFYRLVRLRRGTFSQIQEQSEEITNNLKNKHTKVSPADALNRPDEELANLYNAGRQKAKKYKAREPKVGDKCRVLIKMRKNMRPLLKIGPVSRGYKSYHARHFTRQVHKITRIIDAPAADDPDPPARAPRYFVNKRWVDRDEILLVSGTDSETDRQVEARKK